MPTFVTSVELCEYALTLFSYQFVTFLNWWSDKRRYAKLADQSHHKIRHVHIWRCQSEL